MKAPPTVPWSILPPITREVEFLHESLWRGALTSQEFALCLLLAESRGEPQSDDFLTWLMEMPSGEMEVHRRSLRQRTILDFTSAGKAGARAPDSRKRRAGSCLSAAHAFTYFARMICSSRSAPSAACLPSTMIGSHFHSSTAGPPITEFAEPVTNSTGSREVNRNEHRRCTCGA